MMGFEPTTPGTTNQCSNRVSYNRHLGLQKYTNQGTSQIRIEKNGDKTEILSPFFYFCAATYLFSAAFQSITFQNAST